KIVRRDSHCGGAGKAIGGGKGHPVEGCVDVRERATERHCCVGGTVTCSSSVGIAEGEAQSTCSTECQRTVSGRQRYLDDVPSRVHIRNRNLIAVTARENQRRILCCSLRTRHSIHWRIVDGIDSDSARRETGICTVVDGKGHRARGS